MAEETRNDLSPQEFITKWGPGGPAFTLNEEQGAQSHFLDLCEMLGVSKPGSEAGYVFEKQSLVLGEARGYADVFKNGVFAWENKAPGKNLDAALKQLLSYSLALNNPPILVVCDRLTIRIHTQFTGYPTETFTVRLATLDQPEQIALLRRIWKDPESFRPAKSSRTITEEAARSFATLADGLRKRGPSRATHPVEAQKHDDEVAHFLTQCLFCFFAEDVGLLPGRMFDNLVNNPKLTSDKLIAGLKNLFTTMRDGGLYGNDDIPWFNGGLFRKIKVPTLTIMEMTELRNAAVMDWKAIDVSIFGTLFERGLDPSKRSQLGAHYTDTGTIMRIVEPVLERPLLQMWAKVVEEMKVLLAKSKKKGDAKYKAAQGLFVTWLEKLKEFRVLDPACGSGNFLFLGLKALKDVELKTHLEAHELGLDREADLVTGPHNMLGIELNEYAAELARVTVWIGELQWRLLHGYEFKTNPVLEPLDHIECRDALILTANDGSISQAEWPPASVVVGNPPFLGGKKQWEELGQEYTNNLRAAYAGQIPGFSDLVCYWFEKARHHIVSNGMGAAGLVATNSIRGGANRAVLERVVSDTQIFEAWSDEAWINEGAAVRVSLIAFASKQFVEPPTLNGLRVQKINADLTSESQTFSAVRLVENKACCFIATVKAGTFEVDGSQARDWLTKPNVNGKSNALVVKRWINGIDIVRRMGDQWLVDFGCDMSEDDASEFELPFAHVRRFVRPTRLLSKRESYRKFWWLFAEPIPAMRKAVQGLPRQMVTVNVAKHRVFAWVPLSVLPDHALSVIARADDSTFGVLHSRFHQVWSLRMGTSLEDRPRYTPTTCFETFPFPPGLSPADTAHKLMEKSATGAFFPRGISGKNEMSNAVAVANNAKRLNGLREAWLNPPEWTQHVPEVVPLGMTVSPFPDRILPLPGCEKALAERTLTKLYNDPPSWLVAAHRNLDYSVANAYGWLDYEADWSDEEILKRLLALNVERAAAGDTGA